MTPKEQRIAIAKAIGWKIIEDDHFKLLHGPHHPSGTGFACGKHLTEDECFLAFFDSDETESIPDYVYDLNAMHEVRLSLNPLQVNQFVYELARVLDIDVDEPTDPEEMFNFANASAAQRAEAFLRTIGKWKD